MSSTASNDPAGVGAESTEPMSLDRDDAPSAGSDPETYRGRDDLAGYDAMTDQEASGEGLGDNDINITESEGPQLEAGDDLDTGSGLSRPRG
ncbi:MAG: hypothetical protein JWP30_1079 [Homoserinimonas sp.]|jgi:hypothetical protein|nr:hypothetical protein [Homoserinimonas sp.]